MTGPADLARLDQEDVGVAIDEDRLDVLDVSRGPPLVPGRPPRPRVEMGLARRQRPPQRALRPSRPSSGRRPSRHPARSPGSGRRRSTSGRRIGKAGFRAGHAESSSVRWRRKNPGIRWCPKLVDPSESAAALTPRALTPALSRGAREEEKSGSLSPGRGSGVRVRRPMFRFCESIRAAFQSFWDTTRKCPCRRQLLPGSSRSDAGRIRSKSRR